MLGRSCHIFETGDHLHFGEASRHTMAPTYRQYTSYERFHLGDACLAIVLLLEDAMQHGYLGILAGAWSTPRFQPPVLAWPLKCLSSRIVHNVC